VLVLEPNPRLNTWLVKNLQKEGYAVHPTTTSEEALDLTNSSPLDVVLLEFPLPDADGAAVLEELRKRSEAGVIVLSERNGESDKVRVLDAGADDYVEQPFSLQELLARVRALLRRLAGASQRNRSQSVIELGDIVIDLAMRRVTIGGTYKALTDTEWRLLRELALHADKVLVREHLLSRVWGSVYVDDHGLLRTYIKQLRKKLEPEPMRPRYILTESGVGYRLAVPRPVQRPGGAI
jgi:two-component system KDP operon response regulator KdpE